MVCIISYHKPHLEVLTLTLYAKCQPPTLLGYHKSGKVHAILQDLKNASPSMTSTSSGGSSTPFLKVSTANPEAHGTGLCSRYINCCV
jgi:hypothetical protein